MSSLIHCPCDTLPLTKAFFVAEHRRILNPCCWKRLPSVILSAARYTWAGEVEDLDVADEAALVAEDSPDLVHVLLSVVSGLSRLMRRTPDGPAALVASAVGAINRHSYKTGTGEYWSSCNKCFASFAGASI